MVSTLPQAFGQAAPLTVQRIEVSGCPALLSEEEKVLCAPNSTLAALFGEIPIEMSLATVICALPWLAGCATLLAAIFMVEGDGKSGGAV